MKAPTEKHLEDWIVAHPEQLTPTDGEFTWRLFETIIKRQSRFPVGIADLIVRTDTSIAVIELKKGAIDSNSIVQCIRYMKALKEIRICVETLRTHEVDYDNNGFDWETGNIGFPVITGVVIGHKIADPNLLIVANAANIDLYTYDYHQKSDRYSFEYHTDTEDKSALNQYIEWANGAIGDAIVNTYNGSGVQS